MVFVFELGVLEKLFHRIGSHDRWVHCMRICSIARRQDPSSTAATLPAFFERSAAYYHSFDPLHGILAALCAALRSFHASSCMGQREPAPDSLRTRGRRRIKR